MIPRDDERPNTIALQLYDAKYEEGRAALDAADIYPGMALEVTTDEENLDQLPSGVKPNSVAGADVVLRVAVECLLGHPDPDTQRGMMITDAYVSAKTADSETFGDSPLVPYFIPRPGDIFLARVSTDANHPIGAFLMLNSNGTFIGATGTNKRVVQVMEDLDLSDPVNAALPPLLRVQVL
jgi:hypothetical protein